MADRDGGKKEAKAILILCPREGEREGIRQEGGEGGRQEGRVTGRQARPSLGF